MYASCLSVINSLLGTLNGPVGPILLHSFLKKMT